MYAHDSLTRVSSPTADARTAGMISRATVSIWRGMSSGLPYQAKMMWRAPASMYASICLTHSGTGPRMQYDPTIESISAREL